MVLIKEFRIVMPFDVDEYKKGVRYSVARANKEVTKGKDGIELLESKTYEDEKGERIHYTKKIYHLDGYLPGWIKAVLPSSATKLHEESWDNYPRAKTVITSPFLGSRFTFTIETNNVVNDKGDIDNAVGLDEETLKLRQIHYIDIGNDEIEDKKQYKESEDPSLFQSEKFDFGPLKGNWQKKLKKYMCAYKVVTVKCSVFGFQTKAENYIMNMEKNIFTRFHKQVYCWLDEWFGYSFEEIMRKEESMYSEMGENLELDENKESNDDCKKKVNTKDSVNLQM